MQLICLSAGKFYQLKQESSVSHQSFLSHTQRPLRTLPLAQRGVSQIKSFWIIWIHDKFENRDDVHITPLLQLQGRRCIVAGILYSHQVPSLPYKPHKQSGKKHGSNFFFVCLLLFYYPDRGRRRSHQSFCSLPLLVALMCNLFKTRIPCKQYTTALFILICLLTVYKYLQKEQSTDPKPFSFFGILLLQLSWSQVFLHKNICLYAKTIQSIVELLYHFRTLTDFRRNSFFNSILKKFL